MNDVIVIGAGPAGSLSSLLLARAGRQVTVLEQHAFPRDKVCGECLSSRGIDILQRHGLVEPLRNDHPVSLPKVLLHSTSGRTASLRLPRPMLGISRQLLDGFLLNAAAAAGAVVRHRVRCEGVESAPSPTVRVRDLVTNKVTTLPASRVIIADGKGSLAGNMPSPTGDFGIKSHFANVDGPRDAIEMFGCAECYGGIAAIENDRWNVSFAVQKNRLADMGGRLDDLFAEVVAQNPILRQRMKSANRVSPWIVAPVPRYGRQPAISEAILRVGNGSAAMEPICGEGMGIAMRSAELAVQSILQSDGGRTSITTALRSGTHAATWWWRRAACRAAGMIAASPSVSNVALATVDNLHLGSAVLRLAGKN